jgi:hypothetical protein
MSAESPFQHQAIFGQTEPIQHRAMPATRQKPTENSILLRNPGSLAQRPAAPSEAGLQKYLMSLPTPKPVQISGYPAPKHASLHNADAWFDPISSYPYFPLRPSQLHEDVDMAMSPDSESETLRLYPHSFVPPTSHGDRKSHAVPPANDTKQKRTAATLPVDLFDSPEMDLEPPAEFLKRALAYGGVVRALSRHYNTHVCSVMISFGPLVLCMPKQKVAITEKRVCIVSNELIQVLLLLLCTVDVCTHLAFLSGPAPCTAVFKGFPNPPHSPRSSTSPQ